MITHRILIAPLIIGAITTCIQARIPSAIPHFIKRTMATRISANSPIQKELKAERQSTRWQKKLDTYLLKESANKKALTTSLIRIYRLGADIQAFDRKTNASTVHFAAKNNRTELVKLLIALGAPVNHHCNEHPAGPTALHWATHGSPTDADTIAALIQAGAYTNVASRLGVTPLMNAIGYQDVAACKALLTTISDATIIGLFGILESKDFWSKEFNVKINYLLRQLKEMLEMRDFRGQMAFEDALDCGKTEIAILTNPALIEQHRQALIEYIIARSALLKTQKSYFFR